MVWMPSLIHIDSTINNSWVGRCGSKCCEKIRIARLGVAALLDVVSKLVERYIVLVVNHEPDLRARHKKLAKIFQDMRFATPLHFRNQKDFLPRRPRLFVFEAGDVIEPFAPVSVPAVRLNTVFCSIATDMVMVRGLMAHSALRRIPWSLVSRAEMNGITPIPCRMACRA